MRVTASFAAKKIAMHMMQFSRGVHGQRSQIGRYPSFMLAVFGYRHKRRLARYVSLIRFFGKQDIVSRDHHSWI
jgi:hypothetical protein